MTQVKQEIWMVAGRSPALWTSPLVVRWVRSRRAMVRPALPNLLKKQTDALLAVLNQNGRQFGNEWSVRAHVLETFATVTEGGDPEQYVSWSLPPAKSVEDEIESPEMAAFLDAFYVAGSFARSREELRVAWLMVGKFITHYLINHEQPVDLLWFKLHPSGLRGDWKEKLRKHISNLPKRPRGITLITKSDAALLGYFKSKRLYGKMLSGELLAIHPKDGYCYRRADLELTPRWYQTIRRVERQRFNILKGPSYAKRFRESVRQSIPAHLRLYQAFMAEVAAPFAAYHPGNDRSRTLLAVHGSSVQARRNHVALPGLDLMEHPRQFRPRQPKPVSPKDASLSALSPVERKNEIMRRRSLAWNKESIGPD